jgi:cytochrome c biogenesis protein
MSIDETERTAHDDQPPPIVQPRLGLIGWLRFVWRQLTSMRTALMLLMLLAVAAIPGSVFPQNRIDPGKVDAYIEAHPGSAPLLQRLWAFDVYSSPWFSAIYLLLFISLVGCVLPRAKVHLKSIRAAPPKAPRRLDRMAAFTEVTTDLPADVVLANAREALRKRHYRVAGSGGDLSAEKGYLSETGNLTFHLALLGLLVSIAAGSFLAYSGQAVVVEGKSWSNTLPQYDSFTPGRAVNEEDLPPFSFSLNSMTVKFDDQSTGNQFGAAREFEAHVTYRATPSEAAKNLTIRVNHPLDVDGSRVFLVGNGYAPVITVRDGQGNIAYRGATPFVATDGNYTSNGVVKAADAQPDQIGLKGFLLPTAAIKESTGQPISIFPDARNPRFLFAAYTGDLGLDQGIAKSVYQLDVTNMKQLTQNGRPWSGILALGQSVDLPGGTGSVTFDGLKRYAALDIRHDPTKIYVLVFAVLALLGVTGSLFVRRRRVWVRATSQGEGRTVVQVAGLARSEDAGLEGEVRTVLIGVVPADQRIRDEQE